MLLFSHRPDLSTDLQETFRSNHKRFAETGTILNQNSRQIVTSFKLNGQSYIVKRYHEKGLRANLRALLNSSRSMNAFRTSKKLERIGVLSPPHLFLARELHLTHGTSFLIMAKSSGTSLHQLIHQNPSRLLRGPVLQNLAATTLRLHEAGLIHGDLHAGNIFVRDDHLIEVIDLDSVRPSKRKQQRDLNRLIQSFAPVPDLQAKLSEALHSLAKSPNSS